MRAVVVFVCVHVLDGPLLHGSTLYTLEIDVLHTHQYHTFFWITCALSVIRTSSKTALFSVLLFLTHPSCLPPCFRSRRAPRECPGWLPGGRYLGQPDAQQAIADLQEREATRARNTREKVRKQTKPDAKKQEARRAKFGGGCKFF